MIGSLTVGIDSSGDILRHWFDTLKTADRRVIRWHTLSDNEPLIEWSPTSYLRPSKNLTRKFDTEAHLKLKKLPDPSDFSIRRTYSTSHLPHYLIFLSGQKWYREIIRQEMIRSLRLLIRDDISLIREKKVFRTTGRTYHRWNSKVPYR